MSVRYIRVNAISNLFAPATRAFGNIAVIGTIASPPAAPTLALAAGTDLGVGTYRYVVTFVTPNFETLASAEASQATTANNQQVTITLPLGPGGTTARRLYRSAVDGAAGSEKLLTTIADNTTTTFTDTRSDASLANALPPDPGQLAQPNVAVAFTDPATALQKCPGDLGTSIQRCFLQTPGPTLVYGIRTNVAGGTPDWAAALDIASALPVQIVVLANMPMTSAAIAASGPVVQLVNHVTSVSNTGSDGMERIGIAMLPRDAADPTFLSSNTTLVNERMVYIAHRSDDDAAAAVAGTIAGYEPAVSLVLKPVNIQTQLFTPTQIQTINGAVEDRTTGPTGAGVNWLTHPTLIPGAGVYLGEGYTGNPGGGKKFVDIVRVIDDVSFKLKAQLITTIGSLRISRAGLRTLISQMQVVLLPMVDSGILDDFQIHVPLLTILDKPENARTPDEQAALTQAHAQRLVQVVVAVSYAAAIHRISIDLVFS
jgi:hypothetical protein